MIRSIPQHSSPLAIVSAALATTVVCLLAASLIISAMAPVAMTSELQSCSEPIGHSLVQTINIAAVLASSGRGAT